jgi:hypothetical protein
LYLFLNTTEHILTVSVSHGDQLPVPHCEKYLRETTLKEEGFILTHGFQFMVGWLCSFNDGCGAE